MAEQYILICQQREGFRSRKYYGFPYFAAAYRLLSELFHNDRLLIHAKPAKTTNNIFSFYGV